jgi:hypothetical protein
MKRRAQLKEELLASGIEPNSKSHKKQVKHKESSTSFEIG